MQIETLKNTSAAEIKPHLRVAAISHERSAFSFLYIGSDTKCIKSLSSTFSSGIISESFENAEAILREEAMSGQKIDVIIIDIPYQEPRLRAFQTFLRHSAKVSPFTPVLYNNFETHNPGAAPHPELVDDIIDLANWQFDFPSKISFLKKAKAYSFAAEVKELRIRASRCLYKRTFDVVFSSLLLLLTLPLFLLIALAIRLESKGPIFYNAKRAGRGFRIFKFYKFRTMVVNADKKIEALAHLNQYSASDKGPKFFKIANDPRITRVGRFLRNTSLDELPQLFNVLKGDMSLVGNRPLPLYEASTLTTNEFVERFMAPAGITGLWQIKKRGKSDMSIEERIHLDISYARKSTLLYDLWIMANTPGALLQKSDV